MLEKQEIQLKSLKHQLNNAIAESEEKEGSARHWKLKCEDLNRHIKDATEKFKSESKGKWRNITTLFTLLNTIS